jgi:hypothetical protein
MAPHPAEEATIRASVVRVKRERLLSLLGSDKRRKQALDSLNHFAGWDPQYVQPLASSADLVSTLRRAGANMAELMFDGLRPRSLAARMVESSQLLEEMARRRHVT